MGKLENAIVHEGVKLEFKSNIGELFLYTDKEDNDFAVIADKEDNVLCQIQSCILDSDSYLRYETTSEDERLKLERVKIFDCENFVFAYKNGKLSTYIEAHEKKCCIVVDEKDNVVFYIRLGNNEGVPVLFDDTKILFE